MTAQLGKEATDVHTRRPAPHPQERRWPGISTVSIVIPALNEEVNIPRVMETIPRGALVAAGCDLEVIVVDNGSTDRTGALARDLGATVVVEPVRGYGNAYRRGLGIARGDVVVTGDADCTYPFDALPDLINQLAEQQLDFLSTNRLKRSNRNSMKRSHVFGNQLLTVASRTAFRAPFRDSQSGMWVFRRSIWSQLDVRSKGMPFSQEIKNEAYLKGFRCCEVPIEYRHRGGDVKLNAVRDGIRNGVQLVVHRFRTWRSPFVGRRLRRPRSRLAGMARGQGG